MPQSGKVSATVHHLLQQYKEQCHKERKRQCGGDSSPLALVPVSFSQAKDWLIKQQRTVSEALNVGAVNEEAREVISELNRSLTEQPTSTARLLQQEARQAEPVILPPQLSLGPEPVTQEIRAQEQRELTASDPPLKKRKINQAPTPKKVKPVPPELAERQK